MFVVVGATGNTGSAVADTLLSRKQPVRIVVRSADKGAAWKAKGAEIAVASLDDVSALTKAFEGAKGVYLLVPPNYGARLAADQRHEWIVRRSRQEKRVSMSCFCPQSVATLPRTDRAARSGEEEPAQHYGSCLMSVSRWSHLPSVNRAHQGRLWQCRDGRSSEQSVSVDLTVTCAPADVQVMRQLDASIWCRDFHGAIGLTTVIGDCACAMLREFVRDDVGHERDKGDHMKKARSGKLANRSERLPAQYVRSRAAM